MHNQVIELRNMKETKKKVEMQKLFEELCKETNLDPNYMISKTFLDEWSKYVDKSVRSN